MPLNVWRDDKTLTASINKPETGNAINFELIGQLEKLLEKLESDQTVRLFTLTGTGPAYISGGDLREFHQLKKADEAKQMSRRMINLLERIEQLPFWTLAAINGYAYGGGWEISAAFDFRIAASSAKIGFTQGSFYLPPGWGGLFRLSKIVGAGQARFWLASQKVISAEEALKSGFIHDLYQESTFDEDLEKLKNRLVLNDRDFITHLKNAGLAQNTEQDIEIFSRFWESREHQQRVEQFLNRKDQQD